jgi:hypothetical protein
VKPIQSRYVWELNTAAITAGDLTVNHRRDAGKAIATMCTALAQWFQPDGRTTPEQIAKEYAQFALRLPGIPPCTHLITARHGQVCQRVVPAKTLHVGQNATRPPPCMRWRGPCLASPPRIGQLPGLPGAARRPPAPDTRAIHRFPGPFPRPRSCPQMVPVSDGESISTPSASCRARVCGHSFQVSSLSTRCPQNKAAYPHLSAVIHRLLHKKSTGDVM